MSVCIACGCKFVCTKYFVCLEYTLSHLEDRESESVVKASGILITIRMLNVSMASSVLRNARLHTHLLGLHANAFQDYLKMFTNQNYYNYDYSIQSMACLFFANCYRIVVMVMMLLYIHCIMYIIRKV